MYSSIRSSHLFDYSIRNVCVFIEIETACRQCTHTAAVKNQHQSLPNKHNFPRQPSTVIENICENFFPKKRRNKRTSVFTVSALSEPTDSSDKICINWHFSLWQQWQTSRYTAVCIVCQFNRFSNVVFAGNEFVDVVAVAAAAVGFGSV